MSSNVSSSNDNGIVPQLRLVQLAAPVVVAGPPSGGGGGGPDDPMLTMRVEALERGIGEIRDIVVRIEKKQDDYSRDFLDLRRDMIAVGQVSSDLKQGLNDIRKEQTDQGKALSELKGRVGGLPTTLQLILFVIAIMAFGIGRQFFGA